MSSKREQELAPILAGAILLILLLAAIQSGAIPWAILFGTLAFAAALWLFRQWQPALWTGGSVAGMITVIGILNVLVPGWHQNLIEVMQTTLLG